MRVPFKPFQDWLKERHGKYGSIETLCFATGLSRRRVEIYLSGKQADKRIKDRIIREVNIDVVDTALTNEWSTGLWQLYPELYS